jgi:hypothetical protein
LGFVYCFYDNQAIMSREARSLDRKSVPKISGEDHRPSEERQRLDQGLHTPLYQSESMRGKQEARALVQACRTAFAVRLRSFPNWACKKSFAWFTIPDILDEQ